MFGIENNCSSITSWIYWWQCIWIIITFGIVALFSIIVSILLFINHQANKIETFNLSEYNYYLSEFESDLLLGSIESQNDLKEKVESVWVDLFGEEVKKERPYKLYYDSTNKVWLVTGTLNHLPFVVVLGGTAHIIVRESDGKVLAVWHEK